MTEPAPSAAVSLDVEEHVTEVGVADDHGIGEAARVDRADLDAIVAEALVVVNQVKSLEPYLPQLAPDDRERADTYVRRASADATLRAYKSDWRLFCAWCQESGYRRHRRSSPRF